MNNAVRLMAIVTILGIGCNKPEEAVITNNSGAGITHNPSGFKVDTLETELQPKSNDDTDSAVLSMRLYDPKIIQLRGTLVEKHNLSKKYKYYLLTEDNDLYALELNSSPKSDLNQLYDAVGVSLVETAEFRKYLVRKAESQLLPGQTVPTSRIKAVLYDTSLTPVKE